MLATPPCNLACINALMGERDAALALLRESLECGYASATILDDADLASLRGDPQLEVTVAEVRTRLAGTSSRPPSASGS